MESKVLPNQINIKMHETIRYFYISRNYLLFINFIIRIYEEETLRK